MRKLAFLLLFMLLVLPISVLADDVIGQNEMLLTATNLPGTCAEEMPLGDVAADAIREMTGAQIALLPGGCFAFNLQGGDILQSDIEAVFPGDDPMGYCTITPQDLWEMLEISVSHTVLNESEYIDWENSGWDGFLQLSGLVIRYDVSSLPGERLVSVILDDGTKLSPEDSDSQLTLCTTVSVLDGTLGYPARDYQPVGKTLPALFGDYVRQVGMIMQPVQERITAIGSADWDIFSAETGSAIVLFVVCAGVLALTGLVTFGRSAAWQAMKDRAMPLTQEEKKSPLDRFFRGR